MIALSTIQTPIIKAAFTSLITRDWWLITFIYKLTH